MHNEKNEIRIMVQEEVGTSVAHHFGLMQEWLNDQFLLVHEKFEMLEEKWDRRFKTVEEDLDQIKRNTDANSLDILALKTEQEKIKSDIKIIKKKYA